MFQKLHKKAVHLALSVGGSALVAHRTRAGHVQLSATHNVLCAVTSLRTAARCGISCASSSAVQTH